jgi:HD-GYP domain-containing protein (c-di-GMP phosphodiesterase class II)
MSADASPGKPRDFLDLCVGAGPSNPHLEGIQQRASEVLLAVYRLVKIALVHSLDNKAVKEIVTSSHEILTSFAESINGPATIMFTGDTIFVCGELLRASRSVYDQAIELGGLFSRCEVSEVNFAPTVKPQHLLAFAEAASISMRDPNQRGRLLKTKVPNVTVRKVDVVLSRRESESDMPVTDRTLRAYASALLVIRRFYEAMAEGTNMLPNRAKRIAQKLVVIAEEGENTLLGMTTLALAQRDDATRAVHAGILAIVLGRQITDDRVVLSRLAMAALLADAGRAQVAGEAKHNRLVRLSEDQEAAVPTHAAAIALINGGIHSGSALRAVSAFETTWLEREELLGKPYHGDLPPILQSKILHLVRRVVEIIAPRDTSEARSPFDALSCLAREKGIDKDLLRLLAAAVGFIPTGTVVELNTGEWGVVIGPSDNTDSLHLPRIRLVTDSQGTAVDTKTLVDFGRPREAGRDVSIARVIPPTQARFNVTRAFVK